MQKKAISILLVLSVLRFFHCCRLEHSRRKPTKMVIKSPMKIDGTLSTLRIT